MTQKIAYYLKYRPKDLPELIGQETVKQTLLSSFKQQKLSHAYLFTGPKGTGKTSTARILAKMVNCEGGSEKGEVPCNNCFVCLSISDGSNLDLIEIDAASNRGIEDIRSLRDKIKLAPTASKKKVYIIDEAHMLTQEAFNALLKTLEEPPIHALFILATTDAAKIPQTILSRVQRLDFKLATSIQMLEALKKIVEIEKINIDEEGLKILISRAEGSFRDGVKLLDQVSSLEGKISLQVLENFFKSTRFEVLLNFVKAFDKKDTKTALEMVDKEIKGGVDINQLILNLMDIFRNLVFIKSDLGQMVKEKFSDDNYTDLTKMTTNFKNGDLIRILEILQKAYQNLKISSIPFLPLELAVVEICGEGQLEEKLELGSEQIDKEDRSLKMEDQISNVQSQDLSSNLPAVRQNIHPLSSSDDIQKLKDKWTYVLETIRPYNFSLEALLRSINIIECTKTEVFMEVPYSFHQRILEAPKNRDILESVLSEVLGRQIKVSAKLGTRPDRVEDIANIEVAADDEIIRVAAEIFNSDSIN